MGCPVIARRYTCTTRTTIALVLALGLVAAVAIAGRARKTHPSDGPTGVTGWRVSGFESAAAARIIGAQNHNPIGTRVDSGFH
jgi:hypothetical protein